MPIAKLRQSSLNKDVDRPVKPPKRDWSNWSDYATLDGHVTIAECIREDGKTRFEDITGTLMKVDFGRGLALVDGGREVKLDGIRAGDTLRDDAGALELYRHLAALYPIFYTLPEDRTPA